ncbi:MAG: hypothetical protein IPL71_03620 [Anaerolineales bacterium]|uniref:hypothetical protein n=1 Tax=Candidatus Villigracilis proximus TaxID=3140683 RepID=UPI003134BE67|nr:hypothetical protein [Anaerolineales bacterium]
MKKTHILNIFIAHVGGSEIIVRAWVMKNTAVNPRRADDDGIGGAGFGGRADPIHKRGSVVGNHLFDRAPKWVSADFGKQARVNPQPMKRQPRVRDRPARRDLRRADVHQFAWLENGVERPVRMAQGWG